MVILLHQTSPTGYCGWVTYADWAAEQGVRVVLVDLCGWGSAVCSEELTSDPEAQVRLMVDWAREQGAAHVAVVGASMGGAIALGVADPAGADAVVDLSGPETWQDVPGAEEAAAGTEIPLLVVTASGDPGSTTTSSNAPSRARRRARSGSSPLPTATAGACSTTAAAWRRSGSRSRAPCWSGQRARPPSPSRPDLAVRWPKITRDRTSATRSVLP